MDDALGYLFAFILVWYVALTFGCIVKHQPEDASLENPPSNGELRDAAMAITCLVPEPTATGVGIAALVSVAAGYLGVRE